MNESKVKHDAECGIHRHPGKPDKDGVHDALQKGFYFRFHKIVVVVKLQKYLPAKV